MTIKDKAIKQLRKEGVFNCIRLYEVAIVIDARIKELRDGKT